MQLKDMMTPNAETIDANATINEAAIKMKTLDVGMLPVETSKGIAGILTDRDIVLRGIAENLDPRSATVNQIMTERALSLHQDVAVAEAIATLEDQQIRRLLVVDDDHRLVGVISLGDLAARAGHDISGEVLEKVSAPSRS